MSMKKYVNANVASSGRHTRSQADQSETSNSSRDWVRFGCVDQHSRLNLRTACECDLALYKDRRQSKHV